jgi:hypothetical protein
MLIMSHLCSMASLHLFQSHHKVALTISLTLCRHIKANDTTAHIPTPSHQIRQRSRSICHPLLRAPAQQCTSAMADTPSHWTVSCHPCKAQQHSSQVSNMVQALAVLVVQDLTNTCQWYSQASGPGLACKSHAEQGKCTSHACYLRR